MTVTNLLARLRAIQSTMLALKRRDAVALAALADLIHQIEQEGVKP